MQKNSVCVNSGSHCIGSVNGTSSSRANPFVMIHDADTTETVGEVVGFNLIYSGNHYECAQASAYGKTRFVQGINPNTFE